MGGVLEYEAWEMFWSMRHERALYAPTHERRIGVVLVFITGNMLSS